MVGFTCVISEHPMKKDAIDRIMMQMNKMFSNIYSRRNPVVLGMVIPFNRRNTQRAAEIIIYTFWAHKTQILLFVSVSHFTEKAWVD